MAQRILEELERKKDQKSKVREARRKLLTELRTLTAEDHGGDLSLWQRTLGEMILVVRSI
ncbi:MAG: hypothetical protein KGZ25_03180 [Planctomycetes bacterium]|nr:hypothetical protein [Planctomycetota bacterium]